MKKNVWMLTMYMFLFMHISYGQTNNHVLEKKKEIENRLPTKISTEKFTSETSNNISILFKSKLSSGAETDTLLCQDLDTLTNVWTNSFMAISSYDANGNLLENMEFYWNTYWVGSYKVSRSYDSNNHLIEVINYSWNNQQWEESYKYTYAYNTNADVTESYNYNWDGSTWVNASKSVYVYNGNGNLVEQYDYGWYAGNWEQNYFYSTTYDANENEIVHTTYYYDLGLVIYAASKDSSVYNLNSVCAERFFFTLNLTNTVFNWDFTYRQEISYDTDGNPVKEIQYEWDGTKWVKQIKQESTYTNNLLSSYVWHDWYAGSWSASDSSSYSYDNNENLVNRKTYYFNGSSWELSYSDSTIYNQNNINTEDYIFYYAGGIATNGYATVYQYTNDTLLETLSLMYNGTSWDSTYKLTIDYNSQGEEYNEYTMTNTNWVHVRRCWNGYEGISIIQDFNMISLSIYPNPASEYVIISTTDSNLDKLEFNLYTAHGTLVKKSTIQANTMIDCSNLASGLYSYHITENNSFLYSGKLVVE